MPRDSTPPPACDHIFDQPVWAHRRNDLVVIVHCLLCEGEWERTLDPIP